MWLQGVAGEGQPGRQRGQLWALGLDSQWHEAGRCFLCLRWAGHHTGCYLSFTHSWGTGQSLRGSSLPCASSLCGSKAQSSWDLGFPISKVGMIVASTSVF